MPHYPNPFDFVPFPSAPILRTEEQFDYLGEKFSGYLELEIKALTPVHIVGQVEGGADENKSFFLQQDGLPCIPASSIRGCLRAFTEALTAGWVSRANTEYPKKYHGRHVGFKTFENYVPERKSQSRISPPAIDTAFKPGEISDCLDVASYPFGAVNEAKQLDKEEQSRKSKVWLEDAYIPLEATTFDQDWWAPDIGGEAFMGGGKPSASNWWYFEPAEVWKRNLYDKDGSPLVRSGRRQEVAEFIGDHLRGRKFYYHQDPVACVKKYHPDNRYWAYSKNPFHPVRLECMRQDALTQPFRLYLDGIPRSLFLLLLRVLHLQSTATMRHKIGYAKAYGYGSIEFVLRSAKLRTASPGLPKPLKVWKIVAGSWSEEALAHSGLTDLIDQTALVWLARILGWPDRDLLFFYPRYQVQEFQQAIRYDQFKREIEGRGISVSDKMVVNPKSARDIAETIWNVKRPIDFRLYQERSMGWNIIERRNP
ncbi:MAG: RAMP superfamily CRISPR-associated protein [Methanothrix sp.]|nr:RAMP superfamily CRISPR-associated protein [Methanothrix sp.]